MFPSWCPPSGGLHLNRLVFVSLLAVAPLVSGCGYTLAGRGSFKPAADQILVWRFAERLPKLSAEVSARDPGVAGESTHVKRLGIVGVD